MVQTRDIRVLLWAVRLWHTSFSPNLCRLIPRTLTGLTAIVSCFPTAMPARSSICFSTLWDSRCPWMTSRPSVTSAACKWRKMTRGSFFLFPCGTDASQLLALLAILSVVTLKALRLLPVLSVKVTMQDRFSVWKIQTFIDAYFHARYCQRRRSRLGRTADGCYLQQTQL